jgi:hypothetical protein
VIGSKEPAALGQPPGGHELAGGPNKYALDLAALCSLRRDFAAQLAKLQAQRQTLSTRIDHLQAQLQEIDDRLARWQALGEQAQGGGLVGNPLSSITGMPTNPGGAGRAGWVELRMVNGCGPYAYERWWEGGRKRTRYWGKVKGP